MDDQQLTELFAGDRSVQTGKMFGSQCLKVNNDHRLKAEASLNHWKWARSALADFTPVFYSPSTLKSTSSSCP